MDRTQIALLDIREGAEGIKKHRLRRDYITRARLARHLQSWPRSAVGTRSGRTRIALRIKAEPRVIANIEVPVKTRIIKWVVTGVGQQHVVAFDVHRDEFSSIEDAAAAAAVGGRVTGKQPRQPGIVIRGSRVTIMRLGTVGPLARRGRRLPERNQRPGVVASRIIRVAQGRVVEPVPRNRRIGVRGRIRRVSAAPS